MKKSNLWLRSLAAAGLSMSVFLSTLGSVPAVATDNLVIEQPQENDDSEKTIDQTSPEDKETVKEDVNEVNEEVKRSFKRSFRRRFR